jgi:hypothetical protein
MPQSFFDAESVVEIAERLVSQYHPELATARIKYLFQEKAGKKGGKPVLGKVQKVSGVLEHFADCDFLVILAQDTWADLDNTKRTALVDHLLERCTGEEDPEDPGAAMKWKTREPDVHEFSTILQRYGAWTEDLAGFCQVAQALDSEVEAAPVVSRATTRRSTSTETRVDA